MQYVYVLAILFFLVLSGCLSSGNPSIIDQTVVGQIKEGITTKDEVMKLLGKPNSVGRGSGTFPGMAAFPMSVPKYEVWTYQHLSVETDAATFIPIVGLVTGDATSHVNSLTLFFDDKGLVTYIQSNESESESGTGSSNHAKK
jgi:hypothetical protein